MRVFPLAPALEEQPPEHAPVEIVPSPNTDVMVENFLPLPHRREIQHLHRPPNLFRHLWSWAQRLRRLSMNLPDQRTSTKSDSDMPNKKPFISAPSDGVSLDQIPMATPRPTPKSNRRPRTIPRCLKCPRWSPPNFQKDGQSKRMAIHLTSDAKDF